MRRIYPAKFGNERKFILSRLLRLDPIRRSGNRKQMIWIKTNTEKKVDKVLPGNSFILISFKEKVFTQINSQQMSTFRISSHVDCVIQIILTWMQWIKEEVVILETISIRVKVLTLVNFT